MKKTLFFVFRDVGFYTFYGLFWGGILGHFFGHFLSVTKLLFIKVRIFLKYDLEDYIKRVFSRFSKF